MQAYSKASASKDKKGKSDNIGIFDPNGQTDCRDWCKPGKYFSSGTESHSQITESLGKIRTKMAAQFLTELDYKQGLIPQGKLAAKTVFDSYMIPSDGWKNYGCDLEKRLPEPPKFSHLIPPSQES